MRPSSIVFLNDFCIRYIQSEIINSLATHGASECWGTLDSATQIGYGAGYVNNCIHSDSNNYSGGNTVWYNYVVASAGTITNKNSSDTTGNLNTATESICPGGWSLPSYKQVINNRDTANFNPVLGGNYHRGTLREESTYGVWWSSEGYTGARRHFLYYNGSSLYTGGDVRYVGFYIRCVSEEKTVTDLTYMQDMTPEIALALSLCI